MTAHTAAQRARVAIVSRESQGDEPVKRRCVIFCTVLLAAGSTLVSPVALAAGAPLTWAAPTNVDGTNALDDVSCPSSGLCVAVDSIGNVVTGTAAGHGASQAPPNSPAPRSTAATSVPNPPGPRHPAIRPTVPVKRAVAPSVKTPGRSLATGPQAGSTSAVVYLLPGLD